MDELNLRKSGYWNAVQWTPEMCDLVRTRREERRSAERIGAELGISDRAVKNQMAKMGLSMQLAPLPKKEPETHVLARESHAARPQRTDALALIMRQATLPLPAPAPVAAPRTCQWPLWKHEERPGLHPKFCGARTVIGKPYCPCHVAKAYVPRWAA